MMKSIFNDDVDYKRLRKKIDKYEYISFDVFDTLIKRNIENPKDIYTILGAVVDSKYNIKKFDELRINIERTLYKNKSKVTLDTIYNKIKETHLDYPTDKIKELEIFIELEYCQANFPIKKLVEYAQECGKKVIAISDMYLSSDIIKQMVVKAGYDIEKIFVSNEFNASKKTGKLFELVMEQNQIKSNQIIHIGDSFRADYLGAKRVNIASYKIPNKVELYNISKFAPLITDPLKFSFHKNIINNNISNCSSYYEKFGFAVLGPAIFSFSKWIEQKCKENDIKKIFFFSRDGYIMKEAFDIISNGEIITKYINVSRKSLRAPYNAINYSKKDILKLIPSTKQIKAKTIFEYFGLDFNNYLSLLNEFGIKPDSIVYHKDFQGKYNALFDRILPDYIDKANLELKIALDYLKQEGVEGKMAVVDVGWHNSMQYCLESILNDNNVRNDIYGIYFGIQNKAFEVKNYMGFAKDENESDYVESVASYIGLIESFFLEQSGTTLGYHIVDGKIVAKKAKYEYEKNSLEYKSYFEMQQGIIGYIRLLKQIKYSQFLSLNGYDSFLPIKTFGINPYIKDVEKFEDFRFYSEDICNMIGYKGVLHYLFKPKDLKSDLLNSKWKAGFFKKVFKVNCNYYNLYKMVKKIMKVL